MRHFLKKKILNNLLKNRTSCIKNYYDNFATYRYFKLKNLLVNEDYVGFDPLLSKSVSNKVETTFSKFGR